MTDLVKRNLAEIVTEEELDELLKANKHAVTYCGYETSGPVHIGTLVAVNKQIDFMKAGLKVKVLFADVHTRLNRKGSEEWIEDMIEYWRECFIGAGLKAEFLIGSQFQFEKKYIKDVFELGLNSTLNRALRSMQEVARDVENAHVSQIIYPLMQAVDIKALKVDIAHGGMEQRKIHMLARETLPSIGFKAPVCVHNPLLCSLQGPQVKMSSSKPETMISLDETPDSIRKKVNGAYCPQEKEGNPILEISKLLLFPALNSIEVKRPEKFGGDVKYESFEKLEEDYLNKKLHPADLKKTVAESLVEMLEPVRSHLEKKGIEYKKAY
ncbi:MAG: tyrosine--tRNA ligase [Candidatus Altiarchaeales archaeon]|nr:tyrosine--tRNA ligase [Candidatus Altiarchaeales archaeon]